MTLQELVQRYGITDSRIQVGRERLWPAREGIEPSAKALQTLEAALSGADIKGSVRVTEQDHNRLWISKGQVKQPMDATLKAIAETQVAQTTVVVTEPEPAIATPEPTPIESVDLQSATVTAVDIPEPEPEPVIASPEPPSLDSATDPAPEPAEFVMVPPGVMPEELYPDLFQEQAIPEVVSADIIPPDIDLDTSVEAQGLEPEAESVVPSVYLEISEVESAIASPDPIPSKLVTEAEPETPSVDLEIGESGSAIATPDPQSEISSADQEVDEVEPAISPPDQLSSELVTETEPEIPSVGLEIDEVESAIATPVPQSEIASAAQEVGEVEPAIAPPDQISSELVTEAEPEIPSVDLEIGESGSAIATPDPQSEVPSLDQEVGEIEPAIATQTIPQAETAPIPEPDTEAQAQTTEQDTEAQAQTIEQDILIYPQEATNVMNPMATLIRRNLRTFTENVEHPQLKQWGQRLQTLSQSAIPTAKLAAQALGRVIDDISLGSPERLNRAALDAIRIFGKDGVYEGQEFKFENQGGQARISLKSNGTPVFENGQFNHSVPPMQLFKLRDLPEKIEGYMEQVQTKVEQKAQQSTTPRRRNLELVS